MSNAYDTDNSEEQRWQQRTQPPGANPPAQQQVADQQPPPDQNQPPPDQGPPDQGPPDQGPQPPPNFLGNILPLSLLGLSRRSEQERYEPRQGLPEPRWPPTWRENRRQMYIPARPDRGPGGWGKPRQFPMLPAMWQVPGIYAGVGQQLGILGWPRLAMLGMGLNRFTNAFMDGYQRGQIQYTKQQEQQLKLYRDQINLEMDQKLEEYERVFREFGDPHQPGGNIPPEKLEAFKQAIEAVAAGDQHMLNALHNNGVQGVIDQLNWLDAKHSDLRAATRSQEVNERIRDSEDPIFHEGGTHGTGSAPAAPGAEAPIIAPPAAPTPGQPAAPGSDPLQAAPGEEAPAPGEEAPAAPAAPAPAAPATTPGAETPGPEGRAEPTGQPTQQQAGQQPQEQAPDAAGQRYPRVASADNFVPQPEGGQRVAQAQVPKPSGTPAEQPIQSQVFDGAQQKHPRFGQNERGIVNAWAEETLFNNGKYVGPDKRTSPGVSALVEARAGEMANELNRIMADRNLTGEEMWAKVNAISPRLARAIKGYSDGSLAPPKGAAAGRGIFQWVMPLAQQYDRTLNSGNFEVRAAVKRSFGAGADGRNLTSIGTAYYHLGQYRQDLETYSKLPWTKQVAIRSLGTTQLISPEMKTTLGLTDEDVALAGRLNAGENTSLNEVERAITGGKPTVTGRKEQAEQAGWRQDPRAAISAVDRLHTQLEARMKTMRQRFDRFVGPKAGDMGKLFDDYIAAGNIAPPDELGTPETGNAQTNAIVKDAIRGRLPAWPAASAAASAAAPAAPAPSAAPAAPAPAPAPTAPAAPAAPAGIPRGAQTRTEGGKTYYRDPQSGKWYEAD
jgi:hypothetical protein